MYFTQDDYKKIESWLYSRTIKDTNLPKALPINGNEEVPIIQDGKNRIMSFNDFVKQVSVTRPSNFYNVTVESGIDQLSLEEAIKLVPVNQRRLGLAITFKNTRNNWLIYQYIGSSLNQWDSPHCWENIIHQALEELVFWPDEEDITFVEDGNRNLLKFKNRTYNPDEFVGMGMVILRRNYEGTEACAIDDEDHLINLLTQDMVSQPNTVYVVEYDFDLNGNTIVIPDNCVLWFQGGSINNGSIYLKETAILGAFEFADMGNANLFGTFNTGQIMTFSNDSYNKKEGGYFSSESLNKEAETFTPAPVNPDAYKTVSRQELRWWNGEEWILILDITDYLELKSIINDLIDKHNKEMSSMFTYFRDRCRVIEQRLSEAERRLDEHDKTLQNHETRIGNAESNIRNIQSDITNIHSDINNINSDITNIHSDITNIRGDFSKVSGDINNISNTINQLEQFISDIESTITEVIQNYVSTNILGATSITVNGQNYPVNDGGVITLPDYPDVSGVGGNASSADKVNHKLKFTGATNVEYDGSQEITVNIPEAAEGGTDGGTADKVSHKLTFTGDTNKEYDGSQDVTVNIPTVPKFKTINGEKITGEGDIVIEAGSPGNPSGGVADRVANKLKFTGSVTAEYDGSKEVTVNIKEATAPDSFDASKDPELDTTGFMRAMYYNGRTGEDQSKWKSINDIIVPGNFRVQNCRDIPPGCNDYGQLLYLRGRKDSDTMAQMYFDCIAGKAMLRAGNNSYVDITTREWQKILTDKNLLTGTSSQYLMGDGSLSNGPTNADTVDNYHVRVCTADEYASLTKNANTIYFVKK